MNSTWQAESLAFLEKQKARLRAVTSTDPATRVYAYSRDPALLFVLCNSGKLQPPPLCMRQPVMYHNVVLAHTFSCDFASGDIVDVASVNYLSGMVKFFEYDDNDDPMYNNYMPCALFSDLVRVPCRQAQRNAVYVDEIIAFLKRGHSLLDARCMCKHGLSDERCVELGIASDAARTRSCPLAIVSCGGQGPARALADLAKETAISQIDKVRDPVSGQRLLDALQEHDSLTLRERCDTTWVEYTECWIHECKDLEKWVDMHPGGVRISDCVAADYYPGIASDIREMVASGELFECQGNLYPKHKMLWPDGGCLDEDIRHLWHTCGVADESSGGLLGMSTSLFGQASLEHLLRAEGLVPTAQAPYVPAVQTRARRGGRGCGKPAGQKAKHQQREEVKRGKRKRRVLRVHEL